MLKIFLITLFLLNSLYASTIDDKIQNNKSILNKSIYNKNKARVKVQLLAKQIKNQNGELKKLEKEINLVTKDIKEHQKLLIKSKKDLTSLSLKGEILQNQKKNYEEELISSIIEDYSSSIAMKLANKNSLEELIDSEVYNVLSNDAKDKMIRIDSQYIKVTENKVTNQRKIKKLNTYIQKRQKKKKVLNYLLNKHSKSLASIEKKHKDYQKELKTIIKKQNSLTTLLSKLNILKKEELKEERKRKAKLLALKRKKEKESKKKKVVVGKNKIKKTQKTVQNNYAQEIDLDVRILGSSTKGIKISKYRGRKTISPLKKYSVIKKFGKYYDPVYKIKLFNESVLLKTKEKNAKVYNVLDGKIVYSKKDSGMLENVVIIQHKNGLHTIYSHLDQISPTLKNGKWIKKGYVVGRVNETLTFQATKNNAHINPEELFN